MNKLTLNEIKNKLNNHQGWEYENEFLKRDFVGCLSSSPDRRSSRV